MMEKVYKIIFIIMALIIIILLVNRIQPTKSIQQNVANMIGCEDYYYQFTINTPATVNFTVTKANGYDNLGPFKTIYSTQNYSTDLHCGNDYHAVFSAPGYKDFEEDIYTTGFRTLVPSTENINLQKL